MAFSQYPEHFKVTRDPGVKKPKGYRKKKSNLRARRHGIATSGTVKEDMIWLRA